EEALKESAKDIIASDNVLELFAKDWKTVMAGEESVAKLLYLVCTSRLFTKTMHAAIKGPSSAGKSEIRKRLLGFFPPESVVSFTSLSEKALFYLDDGSLEHKILSMGEALDEEQQQFQNYILRELMSEGRLVHRSVEDKRGTVLEVKGPV